MKNIFLTGPIQIGKSTIIKKVIEELSKSTTGFLTQKIEIENASIVKIISLLDTNQSQTFAKFLTQGNSFKLKVYNDILDNFASEILEDSLNIPSLIILDELGFIEKDAIEFQKTVHRVLDSNHPVLGVIKPKDVSFLNSIRARSDIEIVQVTIENRNNIHKEIIQKLEKLNN